MTAGAIVAEASPVPIIHRVTSAAAVFGILCYALPMTTGTTQVAMGTLKREVSAAVVVKLPQGPAVRIVAIGALTAHGACMRVFLAVAAQAFTFCGVKLCIAVTALAGSDGMHSLQGKCR